VVQEMQRASQLADQDAAEGKEWPNSGLHQLFADLIEGRVGIAAPGLTAEQRLLTRCQVRTLVA
jgi:hypothetical protein